MTRRYKGFKIYETKPFISAKYGSGQEHTVGIAYWPIEKKEQMDKVLAFHRELKPDSLFTRIAVEEDELTAIESVATEIGEI